MMTSPLVPWPKDPCLESKVHTEIYTAADSEGLFDENVLPVESRPNDHQWGYCSRCGQIFRWDVESQAWVTSSLEEGREIKEREWGTMQRELDAISADLS